MSRWLIFYFSRVSSKKSVWFIKLDTYWHLIGLRYFRLFFMCSPKFYSHCYIKINSHYYCFPLSNGFFYVFSTFIWLLVVSSSFSETYLVYLEASFWNNSVSKPLFLPKLVTFWYFTTILQSPLTLTMDYMG